MKELQYLNKYFIKYKYRFLLGIFITIVAQFFTLYTPKLVGDSIKVLEHSKLSPMEVQDTLLKTSSSF